MSTVLEAPAPVEVSKSSERHIREASVVELPKPSRLELRVHRALLRARRNNCHYCAVLDSAEEDCGTGVLHDGSWCSCAIDGIFFSCLKHFLEAEGQVTVKVSSLRHMEYRGDFLKLARRALNPTNFWVMRMVYMLGADESLIARKFGCSQFRIKTALAEIRYQLAYTFVTTQPYGIYPLGEY